MICLASDAFDETSGPDWHRIGMSISSETKWQSSRYIELESKCFGCLTCRTEASKRVFLLSRRRCASTTIKALAKKAPNATTRMVTKSCRPDDVTKSNWTIFNFCMHCVAHRKAGAELKSFPCKYWQHGCLAAHGSKYATAFSVRSCRVFQNPVSCQPR